MKHSRDGLVLGLAFLLGSGPPYGMVSLSTIPYAEAVERAGSRDCANPFTLVAGLVVLATLLWWMSWS